MSSNKIIQTCDMHLHTRHSPDSTEPMQACCERAVALGVDLICFTDHLDFEGKNLGYYKPEAYFDELQRAQENYAGRLEILAGLELSEPHLHQDELEAAQRRPYDFILGGVHWWGYGSIDHNKPADIAACFADYWESIRSMAACGGIDAIAHLDFPKRYLRCLQYDPAVLDEIFEHMQRNDLVLELNTASLRLGLAEPCPGEALLRQYMARGGKYITMGSDAHKAEDLYTNVPEIRAWAEGLGLKAVYYRARSRAELCDS